MSRTAAARKNEFELDAKIMRATCRTAAEYFKQWFPNGLKPGTIPPVSVRDNPLILGLVGFDNTSLAIAVGAAGAVCGERPVKTVIIPWLPNMSTLVSWNNGKNAAAGIYLEPTNCGLEEVVPKEPLLLDGLVLGYSGTHDDRGFDPSMLFDGQKVDAIGRNKLLAKQAFVECGIPVPEWMELPREDKSSWKARLDYFTMRPGDFVVKASDGKQGNEVLLFDRHDIAKALEFALLLDARGSTVFLEKRIMPIELNPKGRGIDWNIRALLTLEDNPLWIDAEIRAGLMGKRPINLCRGAHANVFEKAVGHGIIDAGAVITQCEQAARAIWKKLKAMGKITPGIVGLDLIVTADRTAVFLEANTGCIGGFQTLTDLRHRPLERIRSMVERFGDTLVNNRLTTRIGGGIERIETLSVVTPPELAVCNWAWALKDEPESVGIALAAAQAVWDGSKPDSRFVLEVMSQTLFAGKKNEDALRVAKRAIELEPEKEGARMNYANMLAALDRIDEAIEQFEILERQHPKSPTTMARLAVLYSMAGRYDDAIMKFSLAAICGYAPHFDKENLSSEIWAILNLYSIKNDPRGSKTDICKEIAKGLIEKGFEFRIPDGVSPQIKAAYEDVRELFEAASGHQTDALQ